LYVSVRTANGLPPFLANMDQKGKATASPALEQFGTE
jgi:hypothetical protein